MGSEEAKAVCHTPQPALGDRYRVMTTASAGIALDVGNVYEICYSSCGNFISCALSQSCDGAGLKIQLGKTRTRR